MTTIEFPQNLKWGAATAAYQIEGAANKDGRAPSIWDTFSHTPGNVKNGDNGDDACDSYHRYQEDVQYLKELGVDVYRFSISWPRVMPGATGDLNPEGVSYYRNLIQELVDNGIEPIITLYHWDLPQSLQDHGGWENRRTVDAFQEYASAMFREFGDVVKKWITINEPWCASFLSNYLGVHAPGKQDLQAAIDVAHHLLLAHGKSVQAFRDIVPDGEIGYAPNVDWLEPYSQDQEDKDACEREMQWKVQWFMDPVFKGEYPQLLQDIFAKHNGHVKLEEGDMDIISQPIDFMGINYYSGHVARHKKGNGMFEVEPIWVDYDKTDIGWPVYADGFYNVLTHLQQLYGDIPIYITENGACYNHEVKDGIVNDQERIDYLKQHLTALHRAIKSGVPIKGYILWSLLDNFEWAEGYSKRFGIIHVNYRTFERTKKESFYWYKQTVHNNWFEI
ncbi:beta-glucosidase [Pontibacillus yanchengensis]|uniref:Beta-glucosidase n=2 Tax=Pontibacillus yanchengensis TaxID=462910 RepID=A0A6I4ZW21_9BACI|nr:GH1 family beta-glucosidase [Pontibacillus yanchengensis]MYL32052.1 beta-glucosidase [Pontibacillus yanchengensis]MYL52630.1 beta-glucosidase [Pontibacillus yanchengensis]